MHVLLADSEPERAERLAAALQQAGLDPISRLGAGETLLEAVQRLQPDLVIVDMERPDRDTLDGLRHLSARLPRPIVMFTDRDDAAFMREAIGAGVSSYNVVGAHLPDVKPIIEVAIAIFGRFAALEGERRQAEATLRERLMIDHAKAFLIRTRSCSEPEAYRWLRRQAMREGRRIADIAADLLETAHER